MHRESDILFTKTLSIRRGKARGILLSKEVSKSIGIEHNNQESQCVCVNNTHKRWVWIVTVKNHKETAVS